MSFKRAAGLLLHPTSLPGRFGIGDAGTQSFAFIDRLKEAGQSYWQMLPLGPTGYGDSPYQSFSAFAGNTLLISPEKLLEDGLVETDDLGVVPKFPTERVDFGGVYEWKNGLLRLAAERFAAGAHAALERDFEEFSETNAWWLDDYALFRAIKSMQSERPWYEWPDPLKLREPGALAAAGAQLKRAADAAQFLQFISYRQWA